MSQNHMTRWIEIADERHFFEEGMVDQMQEADESHFLHLGATVVKIPSWFRRSVYRRWLDPKGAPASARRGVVAVNPITGKLA